MFVQILFCAFYVSGQPILEEYIGRCEYEQQYKCLVCGKTAPRKDGIVRHLENNHLPGNRELLQCKGYPLQKYIFVFDQYYINGMKY